MVIILINDANMVLKEKYQDSEKIQLFLKETVDWLVQDIFLAMEDIYSKDNSDDITQDFVNYANFKCAQMRSDYQKLFELLKIVLNNRCESLTELVGACYGVGSDAYVLTKFFMKKYFNRVLSEFDLEYGWAMHFDPEVFEIFQRMREQKYGELRDVAVYEGDVFAWDGLYMFEDVDVD